MTAASTRPATPATSQEKDFRECHGVLTLLIGIAFTAVVMWLFWRLRHNFLPDSPSGRIAAVVGEITVFIYFFICGVALIPVPYKGLVKVLGKRMGPGFPLIKEGYAWALPLPFMYIEPINTEKVVTKIEKMEIAASGVPIKFTTVLEWQVFSPYRYLSIGASVVAAGLQALVKTTIRGYCANRKVDEVVKSKDEINNELQDLGDQISMDWGIDVLRVLVEEIEPPESLKTAYTNIEKEEKERVAEKIEAEHVAEMIKLLVAAGLTPQEAGLVVQAERGKNVERQQVIYSGEVASAMAGGIAGFLNSLAKKSGGNKKTGKQGKKGRTR